MDFEVDPLQRLGTKIANDEGRLSLAGSIDRLTWRGLLERAANHQGDQRLFVKTFDIARDDVLSIAQHCDGVAEREYLVKVVRDEEHRDAPIPHTSHDVEEAD
ncbi:hypothetical protein [Aeromicrobium sp. UC242_57]|uniref:hypothetical protein n=1 Tax=Aeromicrobium sp. UC242_57 TaxID=3374624 RepID=UPI0037A89E99